MNRTYLLALVSFFIIIACNNANNLFSSRQEKNVALVKQVFERFNKHDFQGMAALYADPAEFKDPSFGKAIVKQSRQQIATKYAKIKQLYPDVKDEIVGIYPSGDDHVIVEFISSASSIEGDEWEMPVCTIFTIEEGLITRDYNYYDNQ